MRLKIQVDAKREPDEHSVFTGTIFVVLEGQSLAATFDFQMEIVDSGGGDMNIFKIKQGNKPVFTLEKLAGTKGILHKICRESIELAVDLMEERNSNISTYTGNLPCDSDEAAEIKKFLRDTSGDPVH